MEGKQWISDYKTQWQGKGYYLRRIINYTDGRTWQNYEFRRIDNTGKSRYIGANSLSGAIAVL